MTGEEAYGALLSYIKEHGGGGEGSYEFTPIYEGGNYQTLEIHLTQSYNNFDFIIVEQANHNDDINWGCGLWTPRIMNFCKETGTNLSIYGVLGGYRNHTVVNETQINVKPEGSLWVKNLIGVKLGAGGSSLPTSASKITNDSEVEGTTVKDALNNLSNMSTSDVYNGSEQIIGQWFGKPLYRKCFENVPVGTTPHNITNIEKFVKVRVIGNDTTNSYYNVTYYNANYNVGLYAYADLTNVNIINASMGGVNDTCSVILEYTKN